MYVKKIYLLVVVLLVRVLRQAFNLLIKKFYTPYSANKISQQLFANYISTPDRS